MHIGLIGGIGPAATDFYYRRLIATFASKKAALELTIVHADTPTLLSNLASNNAAAQVAIYVRLTKRLVAAGAECVVVTSIAGHFCIDEFKVSSPLPVVDMISEVNRAIEQRGLERIGILGTRTAMETRFYGGVPSAQIIPPNGQDLRAAPGRAKDRCSRKPLADLLHPQIFRRFLAAVRADIERHLDAIRQAVQAGLLDGRNMDENVLAAAIRRDEAITLLAVKPFHCPTRHVALPSQ